MVAAIGLLMAISAFVLWSYLGVLLAIALAAGLYVLAPKVPPEWTMRLFRAARLGDRQGTQITGLVAEISRRAGLPRPPAVYLVPSATLNAFSVGQPDRSGLAITEGLLRKLDLRQLASVIGHEIGHVANGDLETLMIADVMARVTQLLALAGIGLFLFHLPSLLTGETRVPWLAMLVLFFSPLLINLLQLGLSRTREYDADAASASLTGDPAGLASALSVIERYQGRFWQDIAPPGGRHIPQPSLLRSHPATDDRIARLKPLVERPEEQIALGNEPMITMAGVGPASMRPRYRFPGVWF